MSQNLPHRVRVQGYHLSPKIVSSVRGFRWKIPISVNLGVSSLPSSAACISAFRVLRTKPSAARWPSCAPSYSPAGSLTPSELADRALASSARIANILRALEAKGWVEREHSKTDRRRVHVIVTDKGFQDLETNAGNSRTALRLSSSSSAKQIPKRWCAFLDVPTKLSTAIKKGEMPSEDSQAL